MKTSLIIISIVIWVVISFVKAKKKQDLLKKQKAQRQTANNPISGQRATSPQTSTTQKSSYSIESLLEGLMEETPEPQTQTIRISKENNETSFFVSSNKKEKSPYNNLYDKQELEAIMKEGISDIPDDKSINNVFDDDEETNSFMNNEFDLRQAVLFSEILNNPYFEKNY